MENIDNLKPKSFSTEVSDLRVITSQVIPSIIKNLLLISLGMGNAYPSILIPSLSSDPMFSLNEEDISWIGSINLIIILIGSILSGVLTEKIGRKRFMQILSIPLVACWLIFVFASELWQIYLSLSMYGLIHGVIEAAVVAYIPEIAEPRLRGTLSVVNTLSVIFGVLIVFTLGAFLHWRNAALYSCSVPLLAFILLFIIPESPYWLIMRNKLPEAQKSLAWVRGWTTAEMVDKEFQKMYQNHCLQSNTDQQKMNAQCCNIKLKSLKKYAKKNFYWPFALVTLTSFAYLFNGSLTLQTYGVNLFGTFQVPIDKFYSIFVLGLMQVFGCIINLVFVRYVGKRVMALISLGCVAICDGAISIYAYLTNTSYILFNEDEIQRLDESSLSYIPLTLFLLLAFTCHAGIRSLPWALSGEAFTHDMRASACGLMSAMFYAFAFLSNKTFLKMIGAVTLPGVFLFNCVLATAGTIILYFVLPETEGESIQDVINHFSEVSKLGKKMRRNNK